MQGNHLMPGTALGNLMTADYTRGSQADAWRVPTLVLHNPHIHPGNGRCSAIRQQNMSHELMLTKSMAERCYLDRPKLSSRVTSIGVRLWPASQAVLSSGMMGTEKA
jgi:hypothetical protein